MSVQGTVDGDKIILTGQTFGIKEDLKKMGGRWNPDKRHWWMPAERYNSQMFRSLCIQLRNPSAFERLAKKSTNTEARSQSRAPALPPLENPIPSSAKKLGPAPAPRSAYEEELHALLNPDQLKAVLAPVSSRLCVTSGPGSGKTRLLTHRVSWLIKQEQVPETNILIVTFTVKAATEMRERVAGLLHKSPAELKVLSGTFHSVCSFLLRRYGEAAKIVPKNFSIADNDHSQDLIKTLCEDHKIVFPLGVEKSDPRTICSLFSEWKSRLEPEGEIEQMSKEPWGGTLNRCFKLYQERLRAKDLLDFADLLAFGLKLMKSSMGQGIARQFLYVACDEYQDTNRIQWELLSAWSGVNRNILVVGDMQQSIYGWRGATPESNFRIFFEHFEDARWGTNYSNYRSTPEICSVADCFFPKQKLKSMRDLPVRVKPTLLMCESAQEEAAKVVGEIQRMVKSSQGRVEYSDVAVLFRTFFLMRNFEDELTRRGISYVCVGATSFYQRMEIKDLYAYLCLCLNPKDDISFARAAAMQEGVGPKTMKHLREAAATQVSSLYEMALSRNKLVPFVRLIEASRRLLDKGASPADLLVNIIKSIEYKAYLMRKHKEDWEMRWENVGELLTVVSQERFEPRYHESSSNALASLIEEIALMQAATKPRVGEESQPRVTLSTLHASKGMEYFAVYLPALEQGLLPYYRALAEDSKFKTRSREAEEMRLLFVGITRAETLLTLSWSVKRPKFGQIEMTQRSAFLSAIPLNLVDNHFDYRAIQAVVESVREQPKGYCPPETESKPSGKRKKKKTKKKKEPEPDVEVPAAAEGEEEVKKSHLLERLLESCPGLDFGAHHSKKKKRKVVEEEEEEDEEIDSFGMDEEDEEEEEEEMEEMEDDVVWCKCGVQEDDGLLFICCDSCNAWSHAACYGYDEDTIPANFTCERC